MLGLMHHLSDLNLQKLLSLIPKFLKTENSGSSVITFDPVRTKHHYLSNKLCDLDQGQFVRNSAKYRQLLNESLTIKQSNIITSSTKVAIYIVNEAKCK